MGTILVSGILILIAGLGVRSIIRDKRSGKSSCGGSCAHCKGCAASFASEEKK